MRFNDTDHQATVSVRGAVRSRDKVVGLQYEVAIVGVAATPRREAMERWM